MAAPTRVIAIVGKKNAGKTTLVTALAAEFVRQGHRVGTIKHAHHPITIDPPGTDTWRHLHEGHAGRVLLASPGQHVLFEQAGPEDHDPETLVRHYFKGADLVILEGFKDSPIPKIEVHRKSQHRTPLFDPEARDRLWVAMVTDDDQLRVPLPTFRFADTSWLVSLSSVAWDRAKLVSG